jgi:integrase
VFHRHLQPTLGNVAIGEIRETHVRRWRKRLIDSGAKAATVAKAYRLLKAIMATAVDDGLIRRNPCRIRGASLDKSPERPVLTVPQVFALADAISQRYRALILLAVFGSLRWGELAALRGTDIDMDARTVKVQRTLTELAGGGYTFGPPKSLAGRRIVAIPDLILTDLTWHLGRFVAVADDALVFTSPTGKPLHHSNFRRRVWLPAIKAADLPGIHFHDLRHAGNTFAADAGANLRELMERMGHSSTRAALIYLHATSDRQHVVADTVSAMARTALGRTAKAAGSSVQSGTGVARRRKGSA